MSDNVNLGISGRLTRATIASPLTPLMLITAILIGILAILTIPREEEPQISVPMVDIRVAAPGMRATDAIELVGKPLETIIKAVPGVEHVYTQAQDNGVMVTARFLVGSKPEDAETRVEERLQANRDRIPKGIPWPQVTERGINDVPIVVLTLTPKQAALSHWSDQALYDLADRLRTEVTKVDDVGQSFVVGGRPDEIRITPDPAKLSLYGVPLNAVMAAAGAANQAMPVGSVRDGGQAVDVMSGQSIRSAEDLGAVTVRSASGAPVYLRDVATISQRPAEDQAQSWRWAKDALGWHQAPAVSIALAKRPGANAVNVSSAIVARVEALKGSLIPSSVDVTVTRDYGESANAKANELLFHLGLATVSIVILIGFAIGWREAAVTAVVIPTTILLTMFASKLMGYTINRVSLFALIFSIGILVDDAIVVIENIARHWAMNDGRSRNQAAIEAVAEVGNPTIVATLTVVAALLPMLFVSGLMGPYMAPIPVNASAAMIFSFFVAMIIAPWLMIRFARSALAGHAHEGADGGKLGALYARFASRIIVTKRSARNFLVIVGVATLVACSMFYFKAVTVKLLPFDNKSEVQIVVDMPAGTSLEGTSRALEQAAAVARQVPEVRAMEAYAGTAAPFNFNGLVRHYFLRDQPDMGDLMVTLAPKEERSRPSHLVAIDLRQRLAGLNLPTGTSLKVVETPPGPPVLATLLAEVYGPDEATRRATAAQLAVLFKSVPYIVDVDTSFRTPKPQLNLSVDRARLDQLGVNEGQLQASVAALFAKQTLGYMPRGDGRSPLAVTVALDQAQRRWGDALQTTPVAMSGGASPRLVELGEVTSSQAATGSYPLFRRDGRAADMVTAELAGSYEAPIYGMLAVDDAVDHFDWKAHGMVKPEVRLNGQPEDESHPSLLWDGEWEITWVTFRDMGAAFMVALLAIYVLVVAQFRNFKIPLVILTPIPLTLVGIVIGHLLFRAPFTATSMIGFIALAGIIVRNSILLVDFIRHASTPGKPLRDVLIEAGRIRFKPIVLTAAAAMIGAATIVSDPIFQGLALSLLFGLASSTVLTVLVIPAIYIVLRDDGLASAADTEALRHEEQCA